MRKVCYTAIFGDYDNHREPTVISDGWDYVLFTDNKEITSSVCDIRYVEPTMNSVRMARYIKIMYFDFLKDYDVYFWHDSSLQVNTDLNEFFTIDSDITLMKHPDRTCLFDEATTVMHEDIDKPFKILPQMEHYENLNMPYDYGLHATGLLLRKDNDMVRKFMSSWWSEILRGSHRDQLSFDFVRWLYPNISIKAIEKYWELLERENGKFRFKPHGK